MTRKEYFQTDALSRSTLVAFDEHPSLFFRKGHDRDSLALRFGDAFDTLMFDGKEVLDTRYRFTNITLPYSDSTNAGKLTNEVIRIVREAPDAINASDLLMKAAEAAEINPKSIEKTISEFNAANAIEYVKDLVDPTCMRVEDKVMMDAMRQSLLMSRHADMFQIFPDGTNRKINGTKEYIYQHVILFEYPRTNMKVKVMLDIVEIDHDKKLINKIDLKTTSSSKPEYSLFEHRYDIQAALYSLAVQYWAAENYPDYKVDTGFKFLFCKKTNIATDPVMVIMTDVDIKEILFGKPKKYGQYLKNVSTMIEDLKWHITADVWDYPRHVIENGGYIAKIYDV